MSELMLREFAAHAEALVPIPDLTALEGRGRDLRRRRIAGVAASAACLLAVVGLVVLRDDSPRAEGPVRPPDDTTVQTRPYPGNVMATLDPGTYSLVPSVDPLAPLARVTVPRGWNAWEGPNRFNGHAPGLSNDQALGRLTWYVGVLVVKVTGVASGTCAGPDPTTSVSGDAAAVVDAISHVPGYRLVRAPEPSDLFNYPATHLRLVPTAAHLACKPLTQMLATARAGDVAGDDLGPADLWVVDVDGYPLVVHATETPNAPVAVRRELAAVVDSIEFYYPE